jgi:hypothetical protein
VRTQKQQRHVLRRQVDDFTRCGIVLFREREYGRDAYKNERIASIPVNTAFLFTLLTDSRIKVGDNRSEYDNGQLDGLAPFGPLKCIRSISRDQRRRFARVYCRRTDVLRIFWVIAWLWPEHNLSVW